MVDSMFSAIPMRMINPEGSVDFYLRWDVTGKIDEDEGWDEQYGIVAAPLWGWCWLVTDAFMDTFIDEHQEEIMDLGFIIMTNPEEDWVCLAIDGGGFDFFDVFWEPLYDLAGFKWHERD